MSAVLGVYFCSALVLLRCVKCVPQQVTDRRGVDGRSLDLDADGTPTTGSKMRVDPAIGASRPGADRASGAGGSPRGPSDTSSFLRELQSFLGDVSPRIRNEEEEEQEEAAASSSSPVQLHSLQCLPPLALGPASSETLLTALLNSSSPTVFSFPAARSVLRSGGGGGGGELALPPHLVQELRRRLRQAGQRAVQLMGEVEVEPRAFSSLERLREISAFPGEEPPAGPLQYRAFLLLLALQTVARAYEVRRGLRSARAGQDRANVCGLQSLVVSLDTHLVGPNSAAINNCQGACGFPLHNGNNHAILLNAQIQRGAALARSLCCVPVAYEDLQVVELNQDGTYLSIKPNMVAKECGCR